MYYLKLSESHGMDYELITCDGDLELLQMKADILEINKKGIHNNIRWVITDQFDKVIQVSELLQYYLERSKKGELEMLGVWDDHYLKKIINEKIQVGESEPTNLSSKNFPTSTFISPQSSFYSIKGLVYLEKGQRVVFRPGITIEKWDK